jgi:hypothetical protein
LSAASPAADASGWSEATAACTARNGGGVAAPANSTAQNASTAPDATAHASARPSERGTERGERGGRRVISDEYQG